MSRYKVSKKFISDLKSLILSCRNDSGCELGACSCCIICDSIRTNGIEVSSASISKITQEQIDGIVNNTTIETHNNKIKIKGRKCEKNRDFNHEMNKHILKIFVCKL